MTPGVPPKKTEIVLVEDPNRNAMVAELWGHDRMFAEIWQAEDGFKMELYGNPSGVPWVLSVDELTGHFAEAKRLLLARRGAQA